MEVVLNKQFDKYVMTLELNNARTITIILNNKIEEETDLIKLLRTEFNIQDETTPLCLSVKVNKAKQQYRVLDWENVSRNIFKVHSHIPNKTSHFLVPLLGESQETLMYKKYLVNGYFRTPNLISLLYRYFPCDAFKSMESGLKSKKNFLKMEDVDTNFVLFTFFLDEKYAESCQKFIRGKYSEMSDESKRRILSFHRFNQHGTTARILNKDPELRKQLELKLDTEIPEHIDLFDRPIMYEETFSMNRDTMVKFDGVELLFN